MLLRRTIYYLLLLFLFLLPWQTRWVFAPAFLNSGFWEYGSLSFYVTELLAWLIIFLFLVERLSDKTRRALLFSRAHWQKNWWRLTAVVAIFAGLAIVIWHSLNWQISYQYCLRLLCAVCLGAVVVSICHSRNFFIALWLGGVGQGILATWQFISQAALTGKFLGMAEHYPWQQGAFVVENASERWLRAYGSFGSPNSLGIYLAVILVIGLLVYLFSDKRYRSLITAGQLLILSGLVFSFSRGAWIAAAVGVIFLLVVVFRSSISSFKNLIAPLFFYCLLLTVYCLLFTPVFFARFNLANRLETKSVSERVSQLSEARGLITTHPLLGVGPGAYTLALFQSDSTRAVWDYQPVHNIYLLIWAEWGTVLTLLFGCIVILLIKNIWRNNPIYLSVIVTLFIAGLFDHWLFSMWTGVAFLIVMASLSAAGRWINGGQTVDGRN